jgi:hypothetical protein
MHIIARPDDFKSVIERKKGLEHVLFRPKPMLFHHPRLGVFAGKKYVVEMDEHTLSNSGHDFEDLVLNITADPNHMGRIDEKNVILLQRFKLRYWHVLNGLNHEPREAREAGAERLIGERLDGNEFTIVGWILLLVPDNRLRGNIRGVSGTDLNDALWFIMTNEAIKNLWIDTIEIAIGVGENVGL